MSSPEKTPQDEAFHISDNFMKVFLPYVVNLVQVKPKSTIEVYRHSTSYFQQQLQNRQRKKEQDNENRTPELSSSLEKFIQDKADYDGTAEMHPIQWEQLQREIVNTYFTKKQLKEENLQQYGNLNKTIAGLWNNVSKMVEEMLHEETGDEMIKHHQGIDKSSKRQSGEKCISTPELYTLTNKCEAPDVSKKLKETAITFVENAEESIPHHEQAQRINDTTRKGKITADPLTETSIPGVKSEKALDKETNSSMKKIFSNPTSDQDEKRMQALEGRGILGATQTDEKLPISELRKEPKISNKPTKHTKAALGRNNKESSWKLVSEGINKKISTARDKISKLQKSLEIEHTKEEKEKNSTDLRPAELKTQLKDDRYFPVDYNPDNLPSTDKEQESCPLSNKTFRETLTIEEAFGKNNIPISRVAEDQRDQTDVKNLLSSDTRIRCHSVKRFSNLDANDSCEKNCTHINNSNSIYCRLKVRKK